MLASVEEMVDRVGAMAAGNDGGWRAELVQDAPRAPPRARTHQRLRLDQVRRDDGREREERPTSATTASSWSSRAPELATITGSTTTVPGGPRGSPRPSR